jgi:hypothetical protein
MGKWHWTGLAIFVIGIALLCLFPYSIYQPPAPPPEFKERADGTRIEIFQDSKNATGFLPVWKIGRRPLTSQDIRFLYVHPLIMPALLTVVNLVSAFFFGWVGLPRYRPDRILLACVGFGCLSIPAWFLLETLTNGSHGLSVGIPIAGIVLGSLLLLAVVLDSRIPSRVRSADAVELDRGSWARGFLISCVLAIFVGALGGVLEGAQFLVTDLVSFTLLPDTVFLIFNNLILLRRMRPRTRLGIQFGFVAVVLTAATSVLTFLPFLTIHLS